MDAPLRRDKLLKSSKKACCGNISVFQIKSDVNLSAGMMFLLFLLVLDLVTHVFAD